MHSQRNLLSSASILALMVAATTAFGGTALATDLGHTSATLPAVSGVNAKLGGFGASLDGEDGGGGFAALSFPLGHGFGAQLDGVIGEAGGDRFYGYGGHLFWRNPSRGLLGVYASYVRWNTGALTDELIIRDTEVGKVGVESHLYLGPLTLEGLAAYQFGTETGFAGRAAVAYYPRDNLRVHWGVKHLEGPGSSGFVGVEWAPSDRGLSLFADAGIDDQNETRVLAGLKLYLSREEKSLIRRHREDDPEIDLPSDLFQVIGNRCPPGTHFNGNFCDGNN